MAKSRGAQKVKGGGPKGPPKLTDDEQLIREAKDRFTRCQDWESTARMRYLEDIKFSKGDADNGYQWPMEVRKSRDVDRRPYLTINKTSTYCRLIKNDMRQNKSSVKVKPMNDRASYDGAGVMEGLVRYIEYQSNAQSIYDHACDTQVDGGIGYWRVNTRYVSDDSFDQELIIGIVPDPMMVYLDPDIQEPDGSDAMFGFVFRDLPRDQFDEEYPNFKDAVGSSSLDGMVDWFSEEHVRVCEYYRRKGKRLKLYAIIGDDGAVTNVLSDKLTPEIEKRINKDPTIKYRDVLTYDVEWFKIAGDQVIDKTTWVGSTIPLVRVVGEEYVIEKQYDRKGHVRACKDPQRSYNYWSSSALESVALQTKTPWIAPARAIEGYETYWRTANTVNHSILPFNDVDDNGTPIPAPQRIQPPAMPEAYVNGVQLAATELRMVTGQNEADLGEQGNERSGAAIMQRQRAGDNATFHFVDNRSAAIRYTGRILIEAIPKVYDTKRVIKTLGLDGTQSAVQIDPQAQAEYVQQENQDAAKVAIIFNPSFARYAVEAEEGPAFATRRQETFAALVELLRGNPQLISVAGDLLFKSADFMLADEIAERLRRAIPTQLLKDAPDPQLIQALQMNQQLQQHLQTLIQQYAEERQKFKAIGEDRSIDIYKAETDRLAKLLAGLDPQQMAAMVAKTVMEAQTQTIPTQPAQDPLETALIEWLKQPTPGPGSVGTPSGTSVAPVNGGQPAPGAGSGAA